MGANIAGIYGAQIFRSEDSPKYRRGFGINIGVLSLGVVLAVLRYVDDKWWCRRSSNELDEAIAAHHNDDQVDGEASDDGATKKAESPHQKPVSEKVVA